MKTIWSISNLGICIALALCLNSCRQDDSNMNAVTIDVDGSVYKVNGKVCQLSALEDALKQNRAHAVVVRCASDVTWPSVRDLLGVIVYRAGIENIEFARKTAQSPDGGDIVYRIQPRRQFLFAHVPDVRSTHGMTNVVEVWISKKGFSIRTFAGGEKAWSCSDVSREVCESSLRGYCSSNKLASIRFGCVDDMKCDDLIWALDACKRMRTVPYCYYPEGNGMVRAPSNASRTQDDVKHDSD